MKTITKRRNRQKDDNYSAPEGQKELLFLQQNRPQKKQDKRAILQTLPHTFL